MDSRLTAIPLTNEDSAEFFKAFHQASTEEVGQVGRLIAELPEESGWQLTQLAYDCVDVRFLELIYESKAAAAKLNTSMVNSLLFSLTAKAKKNLVDEDVFTRLITGLIKNAGGPRKDSLLVEFITTFELQDRHTFSDDFYKSLDQALSSHIRSTPYMEKSQIKASLSAFKAVELPEALGVFTGQLMASGELGYLKEYIVDAFRKNTLPDSYVKVFRGILQDDVVLGLCVDTHAVFDVPFASIAKIVTWAGEEPFLTEAHLEKVKKALRGKDGNRTERIDQFAIAGADEIRFPIMASFVMQNLKSILREPRDVTNFKYIVPIMGMASRMGHGKQALKLMMEGMMKRSLATMVDDIDNLKPTAVANMMRQLHVDSKATSVVWTHLILLQNSVEAVGLDTLHQVMPDIDGAFVVKFLETHKTELSRNAVLKLFPQAKRFVLENDLGL